MKYPSENSFLDFLKTKKTSPVWLLVPLLVALLLIFGADQEEKAPKVSDETAEICSMISGVGECRVMITYRDETEVFAVAVLCEGAEKPSVRRDITELVCSLYGIGAHRVSILPLDPE